MRTKQKSFKDPMTYLAELRKKARFCQIHKIVDEQRCNHCDQIVNIPEDNEQATEKLNILVCFTWLEHNEFASYLTDEPGRSRKEASFEEII